MKCPKCSYISFDYNQVCPKCNKDISEEQRKLNLPDYRPEPLFLLGALTGAASESQIGLEVESFKDTSELEKEIATGMDDTGVMERETVFGSGAEEFKMEESLPEEMPAVDLSEIEVTSEAEEEEDLTVDLGDLAEESEEVDMMREPPVESVGTGTVVLEDVKMPEDEPVTETLAEMADGDEISLDLDEISDEGLEAAMALDEEDAELSLDLEELGEEAEDLEEIELEPAGEFQEEVLDLAGIDLPEDDAMEEVTDSSHSESEMLTVELEEGKKKDPGELENLQMEGTIAGPDTSGQ
ncbi:MAG: hypothetical protein JRI80_06115 [Deltaproteobacteria bacterium]|nr:hypothetical protein [Deltaproteobacteria bacterium]